MSITAYKKNRDVRSIRQGEPNFMISDGMIMYPRAMIHVIPECPSRVREYLNWAISEGYIKCVAHVYGKEQTMDTLR
jgi:hypothetical protein